MYLNHELVRKAFERLKPRVGQGKGKSHLERTSCLSIALAVAAVMKRFHVSVVRLGTDSPEGTHQRNACSAEFSTLLSATGGKQTVSELGTVSIHKKTPRERINSNFFSKYVVDCAKYNKCMEYPTRPAPLLYLGPAATGELHGAKLHKNWQAGMCEHLTAFVSQTPFTDLAIFCLRWMNVEPKETLVATLSMMLYQKYPEVIAEFWTTKIKQEQVFFGDAGVSFMEDSYVESLSISSGFTQRYLELMSLKKEDLVKMILGYESSN